MESITLRDARRLALYRAGLLKPAWLGLPTRAKGSGKSARAAAHRIVDHFGYLQLDTVSIAGARSHSLVLLSRLEGMEPRLGEKLLRPGEPIFEYWGHEASWIPMSLYPAFGFRRRKFRSHPWWGDLRRDHPKVTRRLRKQIRDSGPLRSIDMEGRGSRGWWDLKVARKVAAAMWSAGELAISERHNFQRSFDLAERVVPSELLATKWSTRDSVKTLLLRALDGHGWATTGTLASTWRLRNMREELRSSLAELVESAELLPCTLENPHGRPSPGWIRPADLGMVERLRRLRPRKDVGVLLSPFDPVLWDRARVDRLFEFEQMLEIFKPLAQRKYGYYCMPVLAGERLVARVDLKANYKREKLAVLSCRYENRSAADVSAVRSAVARYANAFSLNPAGKRV